MFPGGDTTVRDNLFDQTAVPYVDNVTSSHNGYISGYDRLLPTSGTDKVLASLTYDTGWLGMYYLPAGSALIDAGSQSAANAGLVHYTTLASQAKDSGSVDIGLHYVATGASGAPHDSDGEGLLDVIEDKNGNGSKESAETDILRADTDADGLTDYQEVALIGSAVTNPVLWDTDGDGINDADEDADGDLISNWGELTLGTNPVDAFSLNRASNGGTVNKDAAFIAAAAPSSQSGNALGRLESPPVFGATTITWTLLDAVPPFTYDIYRTLDLNVTDSLHQRGTYNQTVFVVPKPSGNAFYQAGSAQDGDGDGLSDGYEVIVTGTSISVPEPDSDGDGLLDAVESVLTGTNPNDADTGNTGTSDGYKDSDNDGLSNLEEFNLGTNPLEPNVGSPIFAPVGGNHNDQAQVSITCPTLGTTIRYTTDGTEPNETSTSGSSVTLTQSRTLKAKAWKANWATSETESQRYNILLTEQDLPLTPPTVSVSPANGVTFLASDTVEILVEAQDDTGIAKVQVYRGDYKVAESATSPLRYTLANLPAGTYTFTAKAIDNEGMVTLASPISITVNASGPVVSLNGLQPFFTSSPGTLVASVAGVNPTAMSVLTLNGSQLVPRAGEFNLNVPLVEGENTFTLVATDNQNRTGQATTKVYLDPILPVIAITAPANNSSFSTTRINVTGTFTETSLRRITVNGVLAFGSGNTFEARNVTLASGANVITATVEDIAGNTSTDTITVTGSATPVDPLQLTVTPVAGFAPLSAAFSAVGNYPGTLQNVFYDFVGNGESDPPVANLNSINHTYSSAGQYFPIVTIQTTAGRFSSIGGWNVASALRINVQQLPVQQNVISIADPVDVKVGGPSAHLFVLSRSGAMVKEYDSSETFIRSIALPAGSVPTGLDVDDAGNSYVALSGHHQVAKYKLVSGSFTLDTTFNGTGLIGKGNQTSGTGNGEFNAPFDVAVTPDGQEIAVSDSGNHRIQRFSSSDGSFLGVFGAQGSGTGQFNTPKGLTHDAGGYLYIVDSGNNRIALTLSFDVVGTSGSSGTALGQFQGAINLGVGPRGIYVGETGNNRVQAFDPRGGGHDSALTPFNARLSLSTQLGLSQPYSIAPIADTLAEKLYIADTSNNRVVKATFPETSAPDATWNAMKTSLLAGNIDQAVSYFSTTSAEDYRRSFVAMGSAAISSVMNKTVMAAVVNGDSAQFYFEDVIGGETFTFPVEFVRENGVWKILEF
jgi:hypothetical protein